MNKEIKERIETINKGEVPDGFIKGEVGLIPVDWKTAVLNDISEIITKTAGKGIYETVSISAGVGFVNQAKKFGKELSGKQYEKYIVLYKGDFSYNKGNSKTYPQGCIYRLNDRETAAVPNVFESFRIKSGCAYYYDQLFTSGFLNKQLSRKINHGVRDDGLLNLTGKDFYSCVLPFPPVKEQEKIAEILSRCDKVIEECEKQVEEYKSLKKTCLGKMFPKKGSNVPEIRFPGFTDAWEQRKVGEFTNVQSASRVHKNEWVANGVPFYRSSDVVSAFKGNDNEKAFISTELYEELIKSSGKLEKDDILITGGGSIGIPYIVPNNEPLYSKDADLIWVKKSKEHDSEYLYTYFASHHFREYIGSISHVGTIAHYTIEQVKDTPVQLPTIAEQRAIGTFFHHLDNLITLHQRKVNAYTQMKKALTQLLLTGIVRVNKQQEISY